MCVIVGHNSMCLSLTEELAQHSVVLAALEGLLGPIVGWSPILLQVDIHEGLLEISAPVVVSIIIYVYISLVPECS